MSGLIFLPEMIDFEQLDLISGDKQAIFGPIQPNRTLQGVQGYCVCQKSWECRFYGQTVSNIENLRARYVLHFSILPTGAPFQLKIPKYLSSRIFLNFLGPPRNAGKVKNTIFLNFYFSASEHCRVIKRHLPGLQEPIILVSDPK